MMDTSTESEMDYDEVVEQALSGDRGMDDVLSAHEYLLGRIDDPLARRATLRLWAEARWSVRCMMFARLGDASHVKLVPELAELVPELDGSGRRDVVRILERLGGVEGEPILEYLLKTSRMSVQLLAADALSESGTRLSMQTLRYQLEHARDPVYTATLLNALDKIEARHPVNANQGSLTLAEDGREGALTLAGASVGEITLYERALEAVSRSDTSRKERALVVSKGEGLLEMWQGMDPAPRKAPGGLGLYAFTSDQLGTFGLLAGMFSAFVYPCFESSLRVEGVPLTIELGAKALTLLLIAVSILGPTLTPIAIYMRWRERYERLSRFITEGEYATARLLDEEDGEVEYVDANGALRTSMLTAKQRARYRKGDLLPILTEGQDVMVLSNLQGISAKRNGAVMLRQMSPGGMIIGGVVFFFVLPCFLGMVLALLG